MLLLCVPYKSFLRGLETIVPALFFSMAWIVSARRQYITAALEVWQRLLIVREAEVFCDSHV